MSVRPLPRTIKIIAAGGPGETRILDADTGDDLSDCIRSVYWQHVAGEPPRAVVTFVAPATEVTATVVCRHCGKAS
jgi:hypothetical protein